MSGQPTLTDINSAPAVVRAESLKTSLKVEPVAPALGAEISNLSIASAVEDDDLFAEIRGLLLKHNVLFFRDQDISPSVHVAFARRFGRLETHPVVPSHPDHPELLVLNRDTKHSYENTWHCDATWRAKPPFGANTALRGLSRSRRRYDLVEYGLGLRASAQTHQRADRQFARQAQHRTLIRRRHVD